ncbi:MAG: hypothetical protein LBL39_03260, partial [Planctomycetaceae bacterium]|nr:hypothetical protein [Planctomycetaceae bacterium]
MISIIENKKKTSTPVTNNVTIRSDDDDRKRDLTLGRPVRLMLNLVLLIPTFFIVMFFMASWSGFATASDDARDAAILAFIIVYGVIAALIVTIVSGVRVAAQWERGVILRFGKFIGVQGPG